VNASRGIVFGVLLSVCGFWLPLAACVAYAQEKPKPAPVVAAVKADPTLTEVQKLQIQNVMLRIELAQRQAQQAQADFDKARGEAQTLIQGLQVPGYDLDLQALAYKPKPPEVKK